VKFDFRKYEFNSSPSLKKCGDSVFKFTKAKFDFTKYEAQALPSLENDVFRFTKKKSDFTKHEVNTLPLLKTMSSQNNKVYELPSLN
jgi:hypothetical protein